MLDFMNHENGPSETLGSLFLDTLRAGSSGLVVALLAFFVAALFGEYRLGTFIEVGAYGGMAFHFFGSLIASLYEALTAPGV